MIKLIYGNPGTGKSGIVYSSIMNDAGNEVRSFIIVPEQTALDTEYRIAGLGDGKAGRFCEVQSFRRLCNLIFREYGGLCYNYADDTVQHLIMNRALKSVYPILGELKTAAHSDRMMAGEMLRLSKELSAAGNTPEELDSAAEKLGETPTGRKLRDISLIVSAYRNLLYERFEDPGDDLEKVYEILRDNSFFAGTNVYFDSFQSFTGTEMKIVREIMKQANSVTVTFSLPGPFHEGIDTVSQRNMSDQIRRCASDLGFVPEITVAGDCRRYKSVNIAFLSSDLWSLDKVTEREKSDGCVRIIRATDIYDEAEETAAVIRTLLEAGYRCSDIAVIARDAEQYRGIIEPEFEKAGIPFFFSEKRSVSHTRPSRLLLSALRIFISGWRRDDVICFLRTGITGITDRDTDIFEAYTETWNISGKNFLTDGNWTMNPDGYKAGFTETSAAKLGAANKVRKTVVDILSVYSEKLHSAAGIADMCRASYEFLVETGLTESLRKRTEALLSAKKRQEAVETASVLKNITLALEKICASYPEEEKITLQEFCRALETSFESVKTGTIPQSRDCVIIGSADMIRAETVRCAVLCGVYDGNFPASAVGKGILNDRDRDVVQGCGIRLSSDVRTRGSDELFFVRRSMSFPSEKLIVFTRTAQPSVTVERILAMINVISPEKTGKDLVSRINSEESAKEYAGLYSGTDFGESVKAALGGYERQSIDASNDSYSSETAGKLFGKRIILSQSKTDTYKECPFRYACRYSLNLSDNGKAVFTYSQSGDFIHYLLEKFLSVVFTENNGVIPGTEERKPIIAGITDGFVKKLSPDGTLNNRARIMNSVKKLRLLGEGIIDDLMNEFSDSSFIPEYFELPIGSVGFPSLSLKLKDGTSVSVTGVADRVDVFRKDGKAYIRIADYKTGDTSFSLDSVRNGEDLQLLLYLFSLAETENQLNCDGTEVIPAAVTYINAKVPSINGNGNGTDLYGRISEKLKRTGLILDSDEIADAVSASRNPHFMPKNTDSVISSENLESVNEAVKEILVNIAEGLKSGNACAKPADKTDTCRYCAYLPVCRYSGGFGPDTEREEKNDV